MRPWDIIGWGLVWLIGLRFAFLILQAVLRGLSHLATRDTPPKPGQTWRIGASAYDVTRVDDGGIALRSTVLGAGTFEIWRTHTQWRQLLREGRGYLSI